MATATRMTVRSALDDDIAVLFAIYEEVVAPGEAEPRAGRPLREVFDEGWVRDRDLYVEVVSGEVTGGYFLRPNFPAFAAHVAQSGYLVRSDLRRRGIGRGLVEHSLAEATASGYTAMMFNLVMEHNPSRQLYESLGFTVVGTIPAVHGDNRAMIYWRSLRPPTPHQDPLRQRRPEASRQTVTSAGTPRGSETGG